MSISVIIPTYNEAQGILPCLGQILDNGGTGILEIIIADSPNSNDDLEKISRHKGCSYLKCKKAGRNHQMNEAAAIANGDVLYFVHADTLVHKDFVSDIIAQISVGFDMGTYRSAFDKYPNPLLRINAFFTRFSMIWCRGGDQTLFVKKQVFKELNGFCDEHCIMEDYDILLRSKGKYKLKIIQKDVLISTRKYEVNSYWNILKANYLVMSKWRNKTASPEELLRTYKRLLK